MARTLFQIMKDKLGPSAELKVYNPLKLRVGQRVVLDIIDLRDKDFTVKAVRENNQWVDGQKYQSVDYDLATAGTNPEKLRVRLKPLDHPDPASGLTHDVAVLSLYYGCSHQDGIDTGLRGGVDAGTGEFQIDWNGSQRKYWRVGGFQPPWTSRVKVVADLDGSGRVDSDEIREQVVEYWDYHTELLDEAQYKYTEYLYVERDTDNGWWQIWRGSNVNPEQVSVF